MTLMKSILLGSAAGILAVASAQAADLPTRKAAPAEYVKICNVGGMAGFIIPGSDTCLKIGGYITAHFSAGNVDNNYAWDNTALRGTALTETSSKFRSDIGFFMRTNISLDTRTNTALMSAVKAQDADLRPSRRTVAQSMIAHGWRRN
jgi:opacity protein-like surface antigen